MIRQRKNRFVFLILLIFGCMVCGSAIAQPLRRLQDKGAYGKPNIILFVADNFTYGDLELVLNNRSNFPNLNKLITNGLFFSRFYSSDADLKQARACLLTGVHPLKKPLLSSGNLNPEFKTLPQMLKESGYKTGILGKWALGGNPIGFDEWFGYLTDEEAQNQYPQYLWRNDKKWELAANQSGKKTEPAQNWFIKTTTNFLRIYREYPFFLYLPSNLPGKSTNQTENPNVLRDKQFRKSDAENRFKSLRLIDEHFENIFDCLEAYKILDKSVILFTSIPSDNTQTAETTQLKEFIRKRLNIPTIAYWQGNIKTETNKSLFYSCDIASTILELADFKSGTNCFSQPLFSKQKTTPRDIILLKLEFPEIKYLVLSETVAGIFSPNLTDYKFFSLEQNDKKDLPDQLLKNLQSKANEILNCLTNVKTSRDLK